MRSRHASSALQALYRVFVAPALLSSPQRALVRSPPSKVLSGHTQAWTRSYVKSRSSKAREPEQRKQKWDDEIIAKRIYLVDPRTNRLYSEADPDSSDPLLWGKESGNVEDKASSAEEAEDYHHAEGAGRYPPTPCTRFDVMRSIDTKTHRLVQLTYSDSDRNPSFIPTCKIESKKAAYQAEKRRKQARKETQRISKVVSGEAMKTLELNWAIDRNDLGHRLQRAKEFLEEGRRVEFVLASKKRGRKASKEECVEVLDRIKETAEAMGAKERGEMQGPLGGFVTWVFQARPPALGGQRENEQEKEKEKQDGA